MARNIAAIDLIFLLLETADTPMHVGGVMLFDRPPGRGRDVVEGIVQAYRRARPRPPFDQVPWLAVTGLPSWRAAPAVDLDHHIRHLVLPRGSDERTLWRLVEDLHESPLDRQRPLFRLWIIDGLPQRRFALYFKVHHALVDGIAATARVVASLARRPTSPIGPPFFAVNVDGRRRRSPPLSAELAELARTALGDAAAVRDVSLGLVRRALLGALSRRGDGSQPFSGPDLPLNQPIRGPRSFAALALPVAEMRTVAHAFGGTINDVAAAAVDAGVHAFLADHGWQPDRPLVAMCPVSLRAAGDTTATTQASAIFVPLGAPQAPAAERMRAVIASLRSGKDEIRRLTRDGALIYAASVLGLAAVAEFMHAGALTGHVANLVISNVPGAREDRYLGGARLRAVYPVSVLGAGIGLNVTLASHFDTMGIGFVGNRAALGGLETLAGHTRRAFDDLVEAAFVATASEWTPPRRRR
ncbi:MAG: wax ester/triacylglycerol synthase family O-acyltransferase [Proteobacteria bacterium]|nr:wax ester/triacylglycerol synthase family O-acyltransferase [Pseudomonadota bacterium]